MAMDWVQTPANRLILHFLDDNGKEAITEFWVPNTVFDPTTTPVTTIATDAQAISEAALTEAEIQIIAINQGTPVYGSTAYNRPADKAMIRIPCVDGTFITIQVGTPLEAVFSNGWDLNPLQTDVANLLTVMAANALNQQGNAVIAAGSGHRRRPPRRVGQ